MKKALTLLNNTGIKYAGILGIISFIVAILSLLPNFVFKVNPQYFYLISKKVELPLVFLLSMVLFVCFMFFRLYSLYRLKRIVKIKNAELNLSQIYKDFLSIKNTDDIRILLALYGIDESYINVTDTVRSKIYNNGLSLIITNEGLGVADPFINAKKELILIYKVEGKFEWMKADEYSNLIISKNRNASYPYIDIVSLDNPHHPTK